MGKVVQDLGRYWEGRRIALGQQVSKVHEAGLLKLNCEKAQNRLGWLPTLTYEECIALTAQWYRRYYSGTPARVLSEEQICQYEK